jgi:hypothetical protein
MDKYNTAGSKAKQQRGKSEKSPKTFKAIDDKSLVR